MEFNSWKYLIFLLIVGLIYWSINKRQQNYLLLVASYVFYCSWDWRFSTLIIISTVVDFICGNLIYISNDNSRKKKILAISMAVNLGLLCIFKYFNFFEANLIALLKTIGFNVSFSSLRIILPVGISFYTFQTMSYTIDIYRKELKPCESFIDFALFVSFFPQLVAGPIERAKNILPQIYNNRIFDLKEFEKGCYLIFWGLFKKVFVADNLSLIVDEIFKNSMKVDFPTAYIAVFAFAFQIYCDFSGYTDIARGSAKLLGFNLMQNFNFPYLATNPRDFWRRWHISLSTWLRDYLYISLGGNRKGKNKTIRNLMLTMTLGGLWHGAGWNYIWWGIYHGGLLVFYNVIFEKFKIKFNRWISALIMFQFTLFGWLLFRCTRSIEVAGVLKDDSMAQVFEIISSLNRSITFTAEFWSYLLGIMAYITPLILMNYLEIKFRSKYIMYNISPVRINFIFSIFLYLIVRYGVQNSNAFIYFQF